MKLSHIVGRVNNCAPLISHYSFPMSKKNIRLIIIVVVLLCLYSMVHVEVEELIYGKTDWVVDALYKGINKKGQRGQVH